MRQFTIVLSEDELSSLRRFIAIATNLYAKKAMDTNSNILPEQRLDTLMLVSGLSRVKKALQDDSQTESDVDTSKVSGDASQTQSQEKPGE